MRDKPCLTSSDLAKAMAACRAEAEKNKWNVSIAIVDDGGYLLAFDRMDGAPPSYRYFIEIVERLHKIKAEDLTENSVLVGSPAQITDTLKKVEAAGFSEVILYFNVGLKPHAQVKEEMDRFMRDVAPAFEGQHKRRAA